MSVIMFYSYKGGSGRTVAAANVAAALTKLGRRTTIIDLDFEAPGLHHVFGIEKTDQFKQGLGIQHYLRGDIGLDEIENHVAIDLLSVSPYDLWPVPKGARLNYIMASPRVANVNSTDPQVGIRMKNLVDSLEGDRGDDFVVIDAASGIRDSYSIAADVSKRMLIFFRWTRQHVEGTLQVVRYQKRLEEFNRAIPYNLVASASPDQEEISRIPDETERAVLLSVKEQIREKIERTLEQNEATFPHIFEEIPELVRLKWQESITVFDQDESPYERLAQKLLDLP